MHLLPENVHYSLLMRICIKLSIAETLMFSFSHECIYNIICRSWGCFYKNMANVLRLLRGTISDLRL